MLATVFITVRIRHTGTRVMNGKYLGRLMVQLLCDDVCGIVDTTHENGCRSCRRHAKMPAGLMHWFALLLIVIAGLSRAAADDELRTEVITVPFEIVRDPVLDDVEHRLYFTTSIDKRNTLVAWSLDPPEGKSGVIASWGNISQIAALVDGDRFRLVGKVEGHLVTFEEGQPVLVPCRSVGFFPHLMNRGLLSVSGAINNRQSWSFFNTEAARSGSVLNFVTESAVAGFDGRHVLTTSVHKDGSCLAALWNVRTREKTDLDLPPDFHPLAGFAGKDEWLGARKPKQRDTNWSVWAWNAVNGDLTRLSAAEKHMIGPVANPVYSRVAVCMQRGKSDEWPPRTAGRRNWIVQIIGVCDLVLLANGKSTVVAQDIPCATHGFSWSRSGRKLVIGEDADEPTKDGIVRIVDLSELIGDQPSSDDRVIQIDR